MDQQALLRLRQSFREPPQSLIRVCGGVADVVGWEWIDSADPSLAATINHGYVNWTPSRSNRQGGWNLNLSIVNASLSAHTESTTRRVQQALDAGYEVTIHEAPVAQGGWMGAGFTVIDPTTGAGSQTK